MPCLRMDISELILPDVHSRVGLGMTGHRNQQRKLSDLHAEMTSQREGAGRRAELKNLGLI